MAKLRAFAMPKWGIEMTEGVLAEWMVAEGVPFKKGDILALIETDKITNEVEAEADGKFARILAAPGSTWQVGELIAVLTGPADAPAAADVDAFIAAYGAADAKPASPRETPAAPASAPAASTPTPAPAPKPASAIPPDARISPVARAFAESHGVDISGIAGSGPQGRITFQDVQQASLPAAAPISAPPVNLTPVGNSLGDVFASPLARRLAVQHSVDLSAISGTGPRGRICKADVLDRVTADPSPTEAAAAADAEIIAMSPMRKAIARTLSHSKSTIPHFYLRSKVRIDALLGLRAQAREATGEAPSINDYIVRACALALIRHPDVNVQVHGDNIHRFASADISVAVATDKGLVTPIVRSAETLSVASISRQIKAIAQKAQGGKLRPEEFTGGSFSISNLGMFGIDQFDAIINPPQGAILAVGAAARQPIEIGHALAFATLAELSLSCDHRAIDGAVGARFMQTLKELIETPTLLTA